KYARAVQIDIDHPPFPAVDTKVVLTVDSDHPIIMNVAPDKTTGNPMAATKPETSLMLFSFFIVIGTAKIIGTDLTKIARPVQKALLTWPIEDTEIIRKQIAIESNVPHIPEMIIVKGENNQNESTQNPAEPGFLDDTYEYSR